MYLDSHSNEAVFASSRTGDRLSERTIQYMLKSYGVTPQILRHTFCQRLIDNNVDVETVSRLAGHKDINVTKKYIKTRMNKRKVEAAIKATLLKTLVKSPLDERRFFLESILISLK